MTLADTVVYPRLVSLFLEHLQMDEDDWQLMHTTIDGQDIDISIPAIVAACRCPRLFPLVVDSEDPLYPIIPSYPAEMTMVVTLSPQATFEGNTFADWVDIDPQYWFLDSVLHLNAFPSGHGMQRRDGILQALYCLSQGYWISVPALI
ncbi:uncharacterized protein LOC132279599 [Cornus florida]|uniref:uncharacterized protein LOC132279599 n=1 Tax=Cornus florida TaxID=4283 RepID=UPI00289B6E6D|nr:uncharacterized protein LOC132279599 [Cornus florida]